MKVIHCKTLLKVLRQKDPYFASGLAQPPEGRKDLTALSRSLKLKNPILSGAFLETAACGRPRDSKSRFAAALRAARWRRPKRSPCGLERAVFFGGGFWGADVRFRDLWFIGFKGASAYD